MALEKALEIYNERYPAEVVAGYGRKKPVSNALYRVPLRVVFVYT